MSKKIKSQSDIEKENKKLEEILMSDKLDPEVLKKLKEKSSSSSQDEKVMAINIAVVGVGQAGSRIAEVMNARGYDSGVINTSSQDLEFIKVDKKLLLEGSLGGTGKDLDLGRQIFEENEDACFDFIQDGNWK